ncbi:MAG TPA: alkaline phosphatase family protein, partial [Vicinamibacteria bacterium]|nr:alkaline phosphatase family protein [Vicinamibacteria bacterium]
MKKAPLLLSPFLLVALGLAARSLAEHAWTAFTEYQTPFVFSSVETAAAEPVVPQVVLVLLDGLRLDTSRSMPFLNEIRKRGADLEADIGLPSFSLPARATLLSGAWQDVHGQTTNMKPRPIAVEHLFQVARRRGVSTTLAAGPAPFELCDPCVDRRLVVPEVHPGADLPALLAELALREGVVSEALGAESAGLFMAELISVDEAGHQWGGVSTAYFQAARQVDDVVRRLVGRLDLTRTTVVITADHGHTDRGGHGGSEPLVTRVPAVLSGAAVRVGGRGRIRQVDLAPTIAVLLGLPIPASNQ